MKCQSKYCNTIQDVQYVIVRNSLGDSEKEFYCQKHLKQRCYMLEMLSHANKIRKEIKGW